MFNNNNNLPDKTQGEVTMTDLSKLTREGEQWRRIKKYANTHSRQRGMEIPAAPCDPENDWNRCSYPSSVKAGNTTIALVMYERERAVFLVFLQKQDPERVLLPHRNHTFYHSVLFFPFTEKYFLECWIYNILMLINILQIM